MKSHEAAKVYEDQCAACHGDGEGTAEHHSREGASNPHMETNQTYQGHDNPEGTAPRGE